MALTLDGNVLRLLPVAGLVSTEPVSTVLQTIAQWIETARRNPTPTG